MEILIILLILLLIFPKLLVFLFIPITLFAILFISTLIITRSFVTLFQAPRNIIKLAFDKATRRNHALEHATVNILEEKYPGRQFGGFAEKTGFRLLGWLPPPEVVYEAAQEGINRLQSGEKNLAYHKRCGTSVVIFNLLFAIIVVMILFGIGKFSIGTWIILMLLAAFISKPFGMLAQRYMTTDTDVKNMYIAGIDVEPFSRKGNIVTLILSPNSYLIRTGRFKVLNTK